MASEFLFYWLSWILWGIIVFFMEERPLKSIFTWLILIVIFCSSVYFSIGSYKILLSFLCMIIVFGLLYTYYLTSFYHLFVLFIIMIGYVAISFWEFRVSLWLSIPGFLFVSFVCSFLVVFMIKGLYARLVIGVLGLSIGQVLHRMILSSYHLSVTIGDTYFFITLYTVILYIIILHAFQIIRTQWDLFLNMLALSKQTEQADHLDNNC